MTKIHLYEALYPNTVPLRGKIVQFFTRAPEGHAAFTTSLCLNASFEMTPCALHHRSGCTGCVPDSEAQPGKLAISDVDACPTSAKLTPSNFSRSHCMGSLLELAIAFLLDLTNAVFITSMYSSFVHHVDRP